MLTTLTAEELAFCDQAIASAKLIMLARQVRDNVQFRDILKDADPKMRKDVYKRIKPHLRFTPKPFYLFKF